jgi:hypothetical protein
MPLKLILNWVPKKCPRTGIFSLLKLPQEKKLEMYKTFHQAIIPAIKDRTLDDWEPIFNIKQPVSPVAKRGGSKWGTWNPLGGLSGGGNDNTGGWFQQHR